MTPSYFRFMPLFWEQQGQDIDAVEQYYLKAIETDPNHALSFKPLRPFSGSLFKEGL